MIHYAASPDVTRSFCGQCGTNLLYVYEAVSPGNDIVLGTLDRESLEMEGVRPDRHFYWASGIEWVENMVANGDSALNGMKLPWHPGESKSEVI